MLDDHSDSDNNDDMFQGIGSLELAVSAGKG